MNDKLDRPFMGKDLTQEELEEMREKLKAIEKGRCRHRTVNTEIIGHKGFQCTNTALPGMTMCEDHASPDAVGIMIRQQHAALERCRKLAEGWDNPRYRTGYQYARALKKALKGEE